MKKPDDILTISDAVSQYAKIKRVQVYYACTHGKIQTEKQRPKTRNVGAPIKYRFRRAAFEQWYKTHMGETTYTVPAGYANVTDAASTCKIRLPMLYEAIRKGEIACIRLDKEGRGSARPRIFVDLEEVKKWKSQRGVRVYRTQLDKPT